MKKGRWNDPSRPSGWLMIIMNSDSSPLLRPGVHERIARSLENTAPATARHREGLWASERLELSRSVLAGVLGGEPSEITFVSSASEANTWALHGSRFPGMKRPDHLLVSPLEHVSVINAASALWRERGIPFSFLPLLPDGTVDLDRLSEMWPSGRVIVSVQRANPETGTLQPVDLIGSFVRGRGGLFHTDFSAALGWELPDLENRSFDLATFSSTALGGPAGIALLWIRRGGRMVPLIQGGAQEDGRRGGTVPVFLAEGLAAAAEQAKAHDPEERRSLEELDSSLKNRVRKEFPLVAIASDRGARRPGIFNLLVPEVDGQALLSLMDREGVVVGTGSSCSAQSLKVSHVLTALGYSPRQAQGSVVLSLGWWNRPSDLPLWERAFRTGIEALGRLNRAGSLA